jgi:hypothetical protein
VLPATSGATPRAPNSAMSAFAKLLLKGAGAPSTQNRRSDPGGAEPTEVGAGRRRENVPPCICCIDSFEPFLGGSASIGAIGRARSVCGTRPPPAVHPAPAMGRKVSDELTSSRCRCAEAITATTIASETKSPGGSDGPSVDTIMAPCFLTTLTGPPHCPGDTQKKPRHSPGLWSVSGENRISIGRQRVRHPS